MIIKVNSHEVGLKFNRYAIEELGRMPMFQGLIQGKKSDINTNGFSLALIFCAYKGWCFVKQIEPVLSLEDFSDWLDESYTDPTINDQVTQIIGEYEQSKFHQFAKKKAVEVEKESESITTS